MSQPPLQWAVPPWLWQQSMQPPVLAPLPMQAPALAPLPMPLQLPAQQGPPPVGPGQPDVRTRPHSGRSSAPYRWPDVVRLSRQDFDKYLAVTPLTEGQVLDMRYERSLYSRRMRRLKARMISNNSVPAGTPTDALAPMEDQESARGQLTSIRARAFELKSELDILTEAAARLEHELIRLEASTGSD